MIAAIFWPALLVIVLAYVICPIVIIVRGFVVSAPIELGDPRTSVSVVIAAYNEAQGIRDRIANVLAQDYPAELLEVVIASDGSTDETNALVRGYGDPRVILVALPRQGKGEALNRAVPESHGQILVFSDANTVFAPDAIRELMRPLSDARVGGVAGNQIYLRDSAASLTADGESAYWDFDRLLKTMQSRSGNVTSATGAIYAIRREHFQPIPPEAMDDFYVSTGVIEQGSRLVFMPTALAFEPVAAAKGVEYQRKLRIITQGLRAVWCRRELLDPFRFGFYAFQLFWHKVLRRLVVFPLLLLLCSNAILASAGRGFQMLLIAQLAFYSAAALGWTCHRWKWGRSRIFTMPYFFCAVNLAALVAVYNSVTGRRIRRWEPERHARNERDEVTT